MSGDQITTLCEQLMKAVNVIMDGGSSSRYRLEALKASSPSRGDDGTRASQMH